MASWDFSCDLRVDFESEEKASIVYSALAVDEELQPDKVRRQMSVSDGKLNVHFEAVEARFLRASFSAFMDVLTLATRTIEEFGFGGIEYIILCMSVSDGKLNVHFEAVEARFLRASFSAFMDVLTLATRTIEEFGFGGIEL